MNIMVTGAAGFIGSHFAIRHVRMHPNDKVVVVDKLTYAADIRFLDDIRSNITFVQGDIADTKLMAATVDRHDIEAIVDFAAETHVDNSIADAHPFLHTNVLGVQSLIEVCKARPNLLFLHISTDEVYGEVLDGEAPSSIDSPLKPGNPYSASKAAGDLLILAAIRTYGIRARITRCTNNYGPHQNREKFLPVVIRNAMNGTPIPVYGEGLQKRDWLYVTDHTDAVECVLRDGVDGKIYLISADNDRPNIEVARAVLAELGADSSLITFVKDRPGHDWKYALDSASVRSLGWSPSVDFVEGLKRTIDWYRSRNTSSAPAA